MAAAAVDCRRCLEVARQGVLLRRRWDRHDPLAEPRRQLLARLAPLENLVQQRLAQSLAAGEFTVLARRVTEQIEADDRYLASLLNDRELAPAARAFLVECFRDDLHWLGTQVAVLEGSQGVDFVGRILLEEEAIERELESWKETRAARREMAPPLRAAARRLRHSALARQVQSLLRQPAPVDSSGWLRRWQAASRLLMRLTASVAVEGLADAAGAVHAERQRAVEAWQKTIAGYSAEARYKAIKGAADDLQDTAGEALTFLEDSDLPEAVRTLQAIERDLDDCLATAREDKTPEMRRIAAGLRRRRGVVAGELQERRLGLRMERLFGRSFLAALERLMLILLIAFMVLLAAEGPLLRYEASIHGVFELPPGHSHIEPVLAGIDLAICAVFLSEFILRFSLARRKWLYIRRNWLTGLVPALPWGFAAYSMHRFALAAETEWLVGLRFLRYLRLPQMARWLRIARPVLRIGRLAAFTIRASDRLVRQMAPLLNFNVVLFERAAVAVEEPIHQSRLATLRERFHYRAGELLRELPFDERRQLVARRISDLEAMLSRPQTDSWEPPCGESDEAGRELPLEQVIARLLAATPAVISDRIGRHVATSVARWCRAFDLFGVRRLPVVRDLVAASRMADPYETTALVANRIGMLLEQALDRVYWLADLYGTVTAPQLVDSIGEYMVKSTERPARRLVLLGMAFLLVSYLLEPLLLVPSWMSEGVQRLIGTPLIVLGVLCLLPLLVGHWFRRIAGEASDFYGRVAEAQFLGATKVLKKRLALGHRAILEHRVLAAEAAWLGADTEAFQSACEAVDRLWKDYLDGAPFHHTDIRLSNQLLGNLALVSLRATRLPYDRHRQARLRRLDLAGAKFSLRGPYLWFRFISRSLAHQTAKLVVNYNAYAIPIARAATASDEEVRRYSAWLGRRMQRPPRELNWPVEFRSRLEAMPVQGCRAGLDELRGFQGNEFTAIHFLSADPDLDRETRQRFGDLLADLMRRDRIDNVRRVFRTYPFHRWDADRRVFNFLTFYSRHLWGGRVLLLPLKLVIWSAIAVVRTVGLLAGFVRDVLHPHISDVSALEDPDPFAVAVRKVHRMRKPLVLECLRMRAEIDPEYLGCEIEDRPEVASRSPVVPIEEDLAAAGVHAGAFREFRELAASRRRQIADFQFWRQRLGLDAVCGEAARATTIAWLIDYRGIRGDLEALAIVEQAMGEARSSDRPLPRGSAWRPAALLCRWWNAVCINQVLEQPHAVRLEPEHRTRFRHLVTLRRGPLLQAVKRLAMVGARSPVDEPRRMLHEIARDPATWSRQLLVLRAVQTLSMLDLWTYRDLVAELGEYDVPETDSLTGIDR